MEAWCVHGSLSIKSKIDYVDQTLKNRSDFARTDVGKFIKEHDAKKRKLIEDFCNRSIDEIEFDLTINCKSFTRQQVIDLIISAMQMNHII